MGMEQCFQTHQSILMEGALGERLKREYHISFDEHIAMASLIYSESGKKALTNLWTQYIAIAVKYHLPFLATTPTRRANRDRIAQAGKDGAVLTDNVRFLKSIQDNIQENSGIKMYAGALMGCRGDAYTGEGALTQKEARRFHAWQADQCAQAGADFLYAGIMPTLQEAIGMADAMSDTSLPYIISFTIQKDGRLMDGTTIHDAIEAIDSTSQKCPLCYMANCVHPTIVYAALLQPFNRTDLVQTRFLGIQANTSPLSYAELDGARDLFCSDPESFARDMLRLKEDMGLKILGGCCGTDHRHMEAVARLMR